VFQPGTWQVPSYCIICQLAGVFLHYYHVLERHHLMISAQAYLIQSGVPWKQTNKRPEKQEEIKGDFLSFLNLTGRFLDVP